VDRRVRDPVADGLGRLCAEGGRAGFCYGH
jgi:hypothetical protein